MRSLFVPFAMLFLSVLAHSSYAQCTTMPDGQEVCGSGSSAGAINQALKSLHNSLNIDVPFAPIQRRLAITADHLEEIDFQWPEVFNGRFQKASKFVQFGGQRPDGDVYAFFVIENGLIVGTGLDFIGKGDKPDTALIDRFRAFRRELGANIREVKQLDVEGRRIDGQRYPNGCVPWYNEIYANNYYFDGYHIIFVRRFTTYLNANLPRCEREEMVRSTELDTESILIVKSGFE